MPNIISKIKYIFNKKTSSKVKSKKIKINRKQIHKIAQKEDKKQRKTQRHARNIKNQRKNTKNAAKPANFFRNYAEKLMNFLKIAKPLEKPSFFLQKNTEQKLQVKNNKEI